MARFAKKYCSVDSTFFTTQTTYEVAAAFIDLVIFVANRHKFKHMCVGLRVSQLLLAKVYYFKSNFFRRNGDKSATPPIKGMSFGQQVSINHC
jgi:hypothetical protein